MNRDQILAIGKEVWGEYLGESDNHGASVGMWQDYATVNLTDRMYIFASRIESLVREECAKQCEEYSRVGLGLNSCAAAIRKSEG